MKTTASALPQSQSPRKQSLLTLSAVYFPLSAICPNNIHTFLFPDSSVINITDFLPKEEFLSPSSLSSPYSHHPNIVLSHIDNSHLRYDHANVAHCRAK